jgi:hypothetical protein
MALQTFAIIETTNPGQGTATITHDPLGGAPDSIKRKTRTIKLDAPPWNHTGLQPYAWDYCPPADPRNGYAVLTLVLDRNVRMLWTKADWYGGQYFGPDNPRLVLVRAQASSLIPPRHAPVLAHQIVRAPYPWASARDDTMAWWTLPLMLRNARSTQSATVIPFENGVTVRHDGGEFEFSVTAPQAARAAFAYEIIFPQELGYSFRCVHTPNVEISGWLTRDFEGGISQVFIDHAVVHRIDQVPAQGAVLSPQRFNFEPFTDFKIQFSAPARRVISVLETVIGIIPMMGALYDAAQLVYTVHNGRTFWGETVALSEDEICVQGLCAILNVALSAAEVTSAIGKVIKARPSFAPALDKGVANVVRQNLDQRFIDAFQNLSSDERNKLVGALNAYAAGQLESRGVLSIANQNLANKIKTLSDQKRALANLFSEDLAGFRSADLQEGYNKYLAEALQKGYKDYLAKRRGPHLGPLDWALKQTTGRYEKLLTLEIGPGYRSVLQSLKSAKVVKPITPEALALIKKYGTRVHHYRDLRPIARGYGDFVQVDHLFERRFWKSQRLNDIIDQSDLMAMIVAKDAQIAGQIPDYGSYVHSHKTILLRDLIPNGEEDRFTMQQWWDAHVWVGYQVKIPENVLKGPLREEFEFLIEHSDHPEKVNFRFDQAEADFEPPNWKKRP